MPGTFFHQMVQEWLDHNLPPDPSLLVEDDDPHKSIDEIIKTKKIDPNKYHKNHDKERFLCRIRCGVLPTREWLHSLYPKKNKARCRHCEVDGDVETFEHLFNGGCPTLDYQPLGDYVEWDQSRMRDVLQHPKHRLRKVLEDTLWDYVVENKLFFRNGKPLDI